jgi:hypothetical protein
MDPLVQEFIATITTTNQSNSDIEDRNTFWTMVNNIESNGKKELAFVTLHPEVLTRKIKYNLVFDYFYEKVVGDKCHPSFSAQWQDILITVVQLLDLVPNANIIKQNKKYMLKLQSTCRTLIKIFQVLVQEDFDMGDPEFLVYSIISRGELHKLEILCQQYVIEDYPGVLDVAMRFGRHIIIKYFINTLNLDIQYYGKILDFENYKDNHRYLYYREHIVHDSTFRHKPIVGASKQDYQTSLNLILDKYVYPITTHTIDKWCELIRSKEYIWDHINTEVLLVLLKKVDVNIPLTHDFKEFNSIIFGKEWSDRKCLIEYCMNLEKKIESMTDRYELISDKYSHLQVKYDTLRSYIEQRGNARGGRIRRDTS